MSRLHCAWVDRETVIMLNSLDASATHLGDHGADAVGFLAADEAYSPHSGRPLGEHGDGCKGLCGVGDVSHVDIDSPQNCGWGRACDDEVPVAALHSGAHPLEDVHEPNVALQGCATEPLDLYPAAGDGGGC